ncbi:uncharacterized protein [Phyllobates terribilis]|uniref:uncharacterized protein n=1 Tax=Phyllobates terribilis TaxID=111132 RepID=UPI003CCB08F0
MGNLGMCLHFQDKAACFHFHFPVGSGTKSEENMKLCEDRRGRLINKGPAMGLTMTLLLLLLHTCCALEITVPPSQVGIVQNDVLLPCTFKVAKPPVNLQYLAIFWHFGEQEIVRYDTKTKGSTLRFIIDEQEVKQGNASLTIRNVTVSDKGSYKCTVIYSPDTQEKQIQLNILAVPVVKIQKHAVQRGVTSLLQCSITNFYPNDMKVIWLMNGKILSGSAQDDRTNADMTFTRNSSVNVAFLEDTGNPKITCKVEHEYLQDPIEDFYSVQYGAAPTVSIKASKTPDGNDQIYMCEAMNYSPEEVTMRWLLDGKRIDSSKQSNNGYFHKEIYHQIQLNGNNQPSQISCEVQHETLKGPITITEEVKQESDCKRSCHFGIIGVLVGLLVTSLPGLWFFMKRDSQRFQVGHIHRIQTEKKVTYYCTASNCLNDVQVTWTIKENNGKKVEISENNQEKDEEAALVVSGDYTVETERSQQDKLHHAISALSFTPVVSKHKEIEIFCKFLCNKQSRGKSLTCNFTFKKPELSVPVNMSLGDNGDVLCSISLQNFYPKDIEIKWSHGLGQFQDVEKLDETFTKNNDFTFNVRSVCRVPGHLFKDQGYRVRAAWSHETENGQKEVSITDSDWRPVMGEIEKSDFIDGKEAKLLCRVSGYFPDVLDVRWLRRDAESQEFQILSANDKYKIPVMEATQQEDKTFTYTAGLMVSVSVATDYGAEFICRVRHPSLKAPLEQSTKELGVKGIQAVNVTLLSKDVIRAEVSHFFPEEIKITWSRNDNKKAYKEYKHTLSKKPNKDGTYIVVSDMTVKSQTIQKKKKYKVIVTHEALNSGIEKMVLRESGKFYLIDNENRKTLLEQKPQSNINVEAGNQEPPIGPQRKEEAKCSVVDKSKPTKKKSYK